MTRTPVTVVRGTRRRYSKRQKITAVIAAEMTTLRGAAEGQGVPVSTLAYWMDDPSFAQYRTKTREDLAAGSLSLANETLGIIRRKLEQFEPRDLTILWGVLTDKSQLLSGHATGRIETKTLIDGMDDHERAALRSVLDEVLAGAAP